MAKKNDTTAAPAPEKKEAPAVTVAAETPVVETPSVVETPTIEAPTVRRGRGRPKGSGGAAPVSPSAAGAAVTKGKPGRPKKNARVSVDASALAKQIQGLHAIAALGTGIPEFNLQDSEAEMLGQAVSAVCEEYDLSLSGKTGAALQLLAAAAMVYAPRVMMIKARVALANAEAQVRAHEAAQNAGAASGAPLHVVGGTDGPLSH